MTLEVCPGGGHCLYDEIDTKFNQRLLSWLQNG
jgi:pimeloyl-ACP methyl ester carboxylesterase